MPEQRQGFQRELDAIEGKVIELFAMVAEDLDKATDAVLSGDDEAVKVLAERELAINRLYQEIEELVNREIALQGPVASDLRFLLSVLRVVPELERSHDLVEHIARRANHILAGELSPRSQGLVERMGKLASGMWRQAADSWYQRDRTVARHAQAARRRDGRTPRELDGRTRLGADVATDHDGDDTGSALLRASRRPCGQHRTPGRLPRGLPVMLRLGPPSLVVPGSRG